MEELILNIARKARKAAPALAAASTDKKNALLETIAQKIDSGREAIREANGKDLLAGREAGLNSALLDRLELSEKRINSMIQGVRDVILLKDPVGSSDRDWRLENGLEIRKVRVPIGVIGIIYESRPNVTVDASALCLKTGNVTVLRGGKEAIHSNQFLVGLIGEAARENGLPPEVVSFIPTTDRAAIPLMCKQDQYIDLMIPRGGHGLIETVVSHARMPVIKHYHGVCHVYVHAAADLEMAGRIAVNAKTQRPGVCNAMETLLVDEAIVDAFAPGILKAMEEKGVKVLADARFSRACGKELPEPENWTTEYLDLILAVRVVEGMEQVFEHLEEYGSHHSDSIVTGDAEAAEAFLSRVDSAAVYWNASTRFTDGAAFGMGAEIGISTDKIHARGPMALEELTSYKYTVRGNGQVME